MYFAPPTPLTVPDENNRAARWRDRWHDVLRDTAPKGHA
jgi:hypothetical protein